MVRDFFMMGRDNFLMVRDYFLRFIKIHMLRHAADAPDSDVALIAERYE